MEGELTFNNIKSFGKNFLVDNLNRFYKSDPIPEMCYGFPTLLFFPTGNKIVDPITLYTDRTVKAFYKFLKQHAAIPFKLQKPESTQKPKPESTRVNFNVF
ncbi:hypothetical protein L2E82_39008 [Cichorium intybus]|uniref:Uncharacterized protein n=1 Tax=Cichorium intybus TaxID=13427 RepID=A0ACB9AIQ8_CICIN|nr:hypothetical protein L2E82_39008 [Cichorium intybus]